MHLPLPDLPFVHTVLSEAQWTTRRAAHRDRHEPFVREQVERRNRGRRDPTMDFLFEYYSYPPSRFLRWSPGFGVMLQGVGAERFLENPRWRRHALGVYLSLDRARQRSRALRWIHELLAATAARTPMFACFGMHEWALVHDRELMHPTFELRVSRDQIAEQLHRTGLRCTHYDAFRFFSDSGKALNEHALSAQHMLLLEQPGCVHTNMDLYRWAWKLAPWVASEIVGEAFELACEARRFDSAMSPYDLRSTGVQPLCIETDEGRKAYVAAQVRIWEAGVPVRQRLIDAYAAVLRHL
ncbi:MAG: hypothetical protein ACI9MC_003086 [Kiritimatiellia bacterium]|jgi:hypothetical protein